MGPSVDRAHAYGAWGEIAGCLASGVGRRIPLDRGAPYVEYFVDDHAARVGLRVEIRPGDRLPSSPMAAIRVAKVQQDGRRLMELSTTESGLFRDFHDLLAGVAERVRAGTAPTLALTQTLRSWSELLARIGGLPASERLGLLGELHVLERLATVYGWPTAVEAWRAGAGEEHDFGLPEADLEVKTTALERRVHHIGSTTQLVPTPGRELLFCSLQFTRGGAAGTSLAERIEGVRKRIGVEAPAMFEAFEAALRSWGWLPEHARLPDERWVLRTSPLMLAVDAAFPRLTPDAFDLPVAVRSRLVDVSYRIDVTDMAPAGGAVASLFSDVARGGFEG
ncbi:hypothetical protein GCM10023205_74390 [Yinghuangia aomiensis]|uniref:PD-(D/E)XK family member n=1 Tax=Yinghuangia aomiensis TaxID=676205 RepID=A0ABP9I9J5_9ACTN